MPTSCGRRRQRWRARSRNCGRAASPMRKSGGWSKRNSRVSIEVEASPPSPRLRRVNVVNDRAVIETAGLWKRYDDVEALRGLDLRVPAGSIFGFLGRNGAGKTTTIKVLLGMARPSRGEARVFGKAPSGNDGVDVRRRTAF